MPRAGVICPRLSGVARLGQYGKIVVDSALSYQIRIVTVDYSFSIFPGRGNEPGTSASSAVTIPVTLHDIPA